MERTEVAARRGLPALALGLTTAAFILTKTGRDALYVQDDGIYALPWAYVGIAALAPGFAGAMLALIRSLGARKARVVSLLAMAVFQLLVVAIARPGADPVMTAVFMLIPLIYGVLLSAAWLLGSELLDGWAEREKAASYAIFGAASMAGGAIGAGLARMLSNELEPQWLFPVGAGGLALAAVVLSYAHKRFPIGPVRTTLVREGARRGAMPSVREIASRVGHPYIRSLLFVAVAGGFVGVFIEFLFFYSVAANDATGKENSAFFSGFYLILTTGSLALQLTLTPFIQRFAGVRGSLLVLPIAVAAGAASTVTGGMGLGYFALRVLEGGLKSSVHRSSWEQTYGPVSQSERSIIKVLVEGVGVRMAEGMAGLLILAWLWLIASNITAAEPLLLNLTLMLGVVGWLVSSFGLFRLTSGPSSAADEPPVESCGHPPEGCPITAVLGRELVRGQSAAEPAQSPSDAGAGTR